MVWYGMVWVIGWVNDGHGALEREEKGEKEGPLAGYGEDITTWYYIALRSALRKLGVY